MRWRRLDAIFIEWTETFKVEKALASSWEGKWPRICLLAQTKTLKLSKKVTCHCQEQEQKHKKMSWLKLSSRFYLLVVHSWIRIYDKLWIQITEGIQKRKKESPTKGSQTKRTGSNQVKLITKGFRHQDPKENVKANKSPNILPRALDPFIQSLYLA